MRFWNSEHRDRSCFARRRSYRFEKMTSITIKLPEAMKEKLEAEARIRGKSCSALIRDSLETKMKRP